MEQARTTRRRKLYYRPGMISLIVVPIMFVCFANHWLAQRPRYGVKEVNWLSEKYFRKYANRITLPERQFLNITLTGNKDSNSIRLQFGELYIREIYANKDTLLGIMFKFAANSTYEDFVRVLDIFEIENIRNRAPSDDGVLTYYEDVEQFHRRTERYRKSLKHVTYQ